MTLKMQHHRQKDNCVALNPQPRC